jgi:chromosome segregation ATPase
MEIVYLVLIALGVFGALLVFVPSFREMVGIRFGSAVKKGSTAVERNRKRLDDIVAGLPAQRALVASVMSTADSAERAAKDNITNTAAALQKYQTNKGRGASPEALAQLSSTWKSLKDNQAELDRLWQEAEANADDAQKDLERMLSDIAKEEHNLVSDQAKADLAAAKRQSATFRTKINDMKRGIGEMAADRAAVQKELDDARNLDELSRGSKVDREIQEIEERAAADAAVDEIEAELAKQSGTTPPPAK